VNALCSTYEQKEMMMMMMMTNELAHGEINTSLLEITILVA
jgi:hypothetical protein